MITTEIDDKKVQFLFGRIKNNAMNMKRPMRIIAAELEESVRENFEVGGRYSDAKSIIDLIGALFEHEENLKC